MTEESGVPVNGAADVQVAVSVVVGDGVGVRDGLGVSVKVIVDIAVVEAARVGLMRGSIDEAAVGATIVTRPSSCRAAYMVYASATARGNNRRTSSTLLIIARLGLQRHLQPSQICSQDYSHFAEPGSPSLFLPYPLPSGTLILG